MTDRLKAFWLGFFIIIALALTAWLILFLKPSIGDGEVLLKVRFSNIDKISEGSLVTFAGKPVGEVIEIREIPDPRKAPADSLGNLYIYELKLKVDSSVKVYTYDEITFATSGLLGEKSIAISARATPPGATPATEVTNQLLYARSTDKLEETLCKLTNVAGTLNDTLSEVSIFIETNNRDFNQVLKSFGNVGNELHNFLARANKSDLIAHTSSVMTRAEALLASIENYHVVERLAGSFDSLQEAASLFTHGNGTLARFMNSDCFYIQLTALLCEVKEVVEAINNYGLLYQFDRKWQRARNLRN